VRDERGQLFAGREPGVEWQGSHVDVAGRSRVGRRYKSERKEESAAFARGALDLQGVTHPLDQMMADREAEARSARGRARFRLGERFEDPVERTRLDAD